MELELSNKNFLVTGSSRGIGEAIAKKFASEHANVGLVARTESKLCQTAENLRKEFSSQIDYWTSDLTNHDAVQHLKELVCKKWSKINGLVLNVGDGRSVHEAISSEQLWSSVWKTNFDSALFTVRLFLPYLQKSKGSIVFISSICGVESVGAPTDYSVAKSALIALSKNLSRKVAPNVRVNVVAPGNIYFKGGTWDEKIKSNKARVDTMLESQVPMKRFGTPDEIADAVVFLSSARSSFITGSTLVVDGGQTHSF